MAKILIVEDDSAILLGLRENLAYEGHTVVEVTRGDKALETLAGAKPDLLILDIMLPGISGFEICRRIRKEDRRLPILMLTARSDEVDKVMGLDLGADDYLTKPFSLSELLARVRALLRRTQLHEESELPSTLEFGQVRLDFISYVATRRGKPVHLTAKEFALIRYLAAHKGEALRRDLLLDRVWGEDVYPTNRTVDTHVLSLRNKLELDPSHPRYLVTVHGVGYKFIGDS
jgi:DNA-binding response OmpR family regulator